MNTIVPRLTPNVWRISGANTVIATLSSSSNDRRSSTTNMKLPPALNAPANETGSDFTPGSSSSGKMTCSRALLRGLACSSSSTVAASAAGPPHLFVAHDGPHCAGAAPAERIGTDVAARRPGVE